MKTVIGNKMESYKIQLIPVNTSKEDSVINIAIILNNLDRYSTEIFNCVSKRIQNNKDRVENINSRINALSKTITKINETNHSIKVLSAAKYPAKTSNYISCFSDKKKIDFDSLVLTKKKDKSAIENKVIFHTKPKRFDAIELSKGPFRLSDRCKSVSDYLFFNSSKSAYEKFSAFEGIHYRKISNVTEPDTSSKLMVNKTLLWSYSNQSVGDTKLYYLPDIGEVPVIDVPIDLPNLPGIADDIRYEENNEISIAPSVVISKRNTKPTYEFGHGDSRTTLETYDEISDSIFDHIASEVSNSKQQINSPKSSISSKDNTSQEFGIFDNSSFMRTTASKSDEIKEAIFPDVPSSIFEDSPIVVDQKNIPPSIVVPPFLSAASLTENIKQISSIPPPPPPPPLEIIESMAQDTHSTLMEQIRKMGGIEKANLKSVSVSDVSKDTKSIASGDLHSSLMDSIRTAGGSKILKPVKDNPTKQQSKESNSGGFMEELHSTILQRRTAISGDIMSSLMKKIPLSDPSSESNIDDNSGNDWD